MRDRSSTLSARAARTLLATAALLITVPAAAALAPASACSGAVDGLDPERGDALHVELSPAGRATADGRAAVRAVVSRRAVVNGAAADLPENGAVVRVDVSVGRETEVDYGTTDINGVVTLSVKFARGVRGPADVRAYARREWTDDAPCGISPRVSDSGSAFRQALTYVTS